MFVASDPHTVTSGTIGGFVVGWMMSVRNQDGTLVDALEDLVTVADSDLTISGNFNVGAFHLDNAEVCTTAAGEAERTALTINDDTDGALLEGLSGVMQAGNDDTDDMDGKHLCIVVEDDNADEISASEYRANVEFAKIDGRAFEPMAVQDELIGRITRNGTTVHIPFVTTHARYAQRIILRNRGDKEIEYTIMVHPEEDNGAMPEMLGGNSDMLPAKTTRVLLTTDVVMFAEDGGNPRGSATLTANVAPNKISVATSLLNREDGSTDTMQHEADMQ